MVTAVTNHPRIRIFTDTLVTSWFEDHWLAAVCGKMLYKVRGQATVFASALPAPSSGNRTAFGTPVVADV